MNRRNHNREIAGRFLHLAYSHAKHVFIVLA
jgi:hypothetical protein